MFKSRLIPLFLTFLLALASLGNQQAKAQTPSIPEAEKQVLIDLYNQCNGANWRPTADVWNLKADPSTWKGITIKEGHVVEIILNNRFLEGKLPESLGQLPELQKLILTFNKIAGPLPKSIFKHAKLQIIEVAHQRDGSGKIATLTGGLPEEIDLPNGDIISFPSNALSGALPKKVNLPKLRALDISNNQFEGEIPEALYNLPGCIAFWVKDNKLSGELRCGNLAEKMPKLIQFMIGGAQGNKGITGTFPASLLGCSNLQDLDFQNTSMSGNIPKGIGKLTKLRTFALFGSKFDGPLPTSIAECRDLQELNIANNQITGPLPDLSSLSILSKLVLSGNPIGGEIPEWLGKMKKLTEIRMSNLGLTGTLQAKLAEVHENDGEGDGFGLPSLFKLDLDHNNLTGEVPARYKGFKKLQRILLGNNKLTGNPLPTLVQISDLRNIGLNDNNFSGELGYILEEQLPSLSYIDISNNQFSGNLVNQRYIGGNIPMLKLINVKVLGNNFDFASFQNLHLTLSIPDLYLQKKFFYVPQNKYGEKMAVTFEEGKKVVLDGTLAEPDDIRTEGAKFENSYQWYHEGKMVSGATKAQYTIEKGEEKHKGTYYCKVTNKIAPNLVLQRNDIVLTCTGSALPVATEKNNLHIAVGQLTYTGATALSIYDMLGRKLADSDNDTIATTELLKGNYVLVGIVAGERIAVKYVHQ